LDADTISPEKVIVKVTGAEKARRKGKKKCVKGKEALSAGDGREEELKLKGGK